MKSKYYILYIITVLTAWGGIGTEWTYSADSELWSHFLFHFNHGNIFHLAANMLVVFALYFSRSDRWWMWFVSYALAVLGSFIITPETPTGGWSGLLLAYYGIMLVKDGVQWKPLMYLLLYMAVSCVLADKLAVGLHFICLILGTLVGGCIATFNEIKNQNKLYGKTR